MMCPKMNTFRWESTICTAARFGLFLCVLWVAGCVTSEPIKQDAEEVPVDTRQHLASYNYNLAQKFWERDRADLAMRYLKMAVRQNPDSAAPRLKILDLLLLCNDADEALNYLEECPEAYRNDAEFLKRRALALDLKAQGNKAEEVLHRLTEGTRGDVPLYTVAVENLLLQGKTDEAFALLKKAHEMYPREPSFLLSLADLCLATDRFDEEVEYRMTLAAMRPDKEPYLREAARAFIRAGRIEEGLQRIAWLDKGTEDQPAPAVSAVTGYLLFCNKEYASALERLKAAFENKQYKPDRDELLALAEIHMRDESFPEALDVLEQALEESPEHELTRAALAWAYYCAGSRDHSKRVIMQAPHPIEASGLLGAMKKRLESEEGSDDSL